MKISARPYANNTKFKKKKKTIFCYSFSQVLTYVDFFLGFHFFQRLFY